MGLQGVELVMRVEREFHIAISDPEAADARTVGQLNAIIARKFAERASRPGHPVAPEPEITWGLLVPIVVEELGVAEERVLPDAEFIRDLGVS